MLAHGAVFIQIVAVRDHYLSAAFSSLRLGIKYSSTMRPEYYLETSSQFLFRRSRVHLVFAKLVIFLADMECKRKNFTQNRASAYSKVYEGSAEVISIFTCSCL